MAELTEEQKKKLEEDKRLELFAMRELERIGSTDKQKKELEEDNKLLALFAAGLAGTYINYEDNGRVDRQEVKDCFKAALVMLDEYKKTIGK